ncbi:MAG: hypothetical protein DMD84_29105 [Candidatus Rokuibacteriota bacterium]|nr:MAG: hypothetical protein DMD84_29105 [Candidatus Rokubacteria bacterium]
MNRATLVISLGLAVVVALPVAVYVGDALVLRYRIGRGGALETISVYLATRLKSGKLEVFTDRQETEVCAHALFRAAPLRVEDRHGTRPDLTP